MDTESTNQGNQNGVYSHKLRAGRRRTYFFDVKTTRSNDYYLTITESKKRFDDDGYDRHKIFLYKEDFNKFLGALNQTVDHVKTELMPDYDFDEFAKRQEERQKIWESQNGTGYDEDSEDESDADNSKSQVKDSVSSVIPENHAASKEDTHEEDLKWD